LRGGSGRLIVSWRWHRAYLVKIPKICLYGLTRKILTGANIIPLSGGGAGS